MVCVQWTPGHDPVEAKQNISSEKATTGHRQTRRVVLRIQKFVQDQKQSLRSRQ